MMTNTRKRLLIGAAAAAIVAVAVITLSPGGNGAAKPESDQTEFTAVERRDLEEATTLDGTLGFPEGESVASRLRGTITSVAEAGTVVAEGSQLFAVDGEPVILLLGATPAFRAIGQEPIERVAIAGTNGVVTSIAAEGTMLSAGDEIARINDEPVILLTGDLPAWRSLRVGSEGADVTQLEASLTALGYDPDGLVTIDELYSASTAAMVERWQTAIGATADGRLELGDAVFAPTGVTVSAVKAAVGTNVGPSSPLIVLETGSTPIEGDDVLQLQRALVRLGYDSPVTGIFDSATSAAVIRWQHDAGAEPDGIVDLGEVVFLPDPVRITEAILTIGRPVGDGSAVLATTGSASVVIVGLPAEDQSLLAVDQELTVVLPDDSEAIGVVTAISGIATRRNDGSVVFETTIELVDAVVGTDLDQAPVDVLVVTDRRAGVLAVPVTALLALAEGGYAVEADAGNGATRLVGVVPGLFADGWVEISSDGIAAGDLVVVP